MDTRPSPSPATSSRSKPVASRTSNQTSTSSTRQQNSSAQPQTSTPPPTAPVASSSMVNRRPSTSAGSSSSKTMDGHDKPTRSSSIINLKQKSSKKLDELSKANKTEELLKGHTQDLESIRNIITCKICARLLYEPYVVACGHIYCYSCLSHWFMNNKKRKTCPDCRTLVTQMPAPAYLIRDMTTIFLNRAELLPSDETLEQHREWQKEEADIVQNDRDNKNPRSGGLFKGLFKSDTRRHRAFGPIADYEDGVERCPACVWELEEGICSQCGYGQGLETYSDFDHSELGSSEDMDGDIDIDDYNEDIFDEGDFPDEDDFQDLPTGWAFDDGHRNVRQWLDERGEIPPHILAGRRRSAAAYHSAGGRRRYSASINDSEMYDDQGMDHIIEEEDEEDLDDEDSSMNSFIDDEGTTENGSEISASVESQTPQPQPPVASGPQRRIRRIDSESPSFISAASTPLATANEEDDDDEEGGPIRPGRQRRQQRMLARANGSRAASSTSTENSADHELDEDTRHLLSRHGWSPLAPESTEMEEDDGDSDGARTTTGWDPTANSSARPRMTNSLTPVADRPPVQTRPRSRVGQSRIPDGSRGLRRRSSVLSVSTISYEDGEADDDDSEIDRDGDTVMQSQQLRARGSRLRLRPSLLPHQLVGRNTTTLGDGIDAEDDDNSDDTTIQSPRRRQQNLARQGYDPRISWMFAQHQNDMQAATTHHRNWFEEEFRSTTPVARPRTASRNRMVQLATAPPFSPMPNAANAIPTSTNASPRVRRTLTDQERIATNHPPGPQVSRLEMQGSLSSNLASTNGGAVHDTARLGREGSAESASSVATFATATSTLNGRPPSRQSTNGLPLSVVAGPEDIIDRPASRLPSRPPSSSSRRGSQGFINFPIQMSPGPGLNLAARQFQAATRNPYFGATYSNSVRPRQSNQRLREQSSTATLRASTSRRVLRPQQSRTEFREEIAPPGALRTQRSRVLRPQPSTQRLQGQPSMRALRQGDAVQVAQAQMAYPSTGMIVNPRTTNMSSRLSEDETRRRANELIRTRQAHIERSSTNPFASNGRRPSISSNGTATQAPSITYGSGGPGQTSNAPSAANIQGPPGSPTINRRRSRNIGLSPGTLPQLHQDNAPPQSRPRLGSSSLSSNLVPQAAMATNIPA